VVSADMTGMTHPPTVRARVLVFHIDSHELPGLMSTVDSVAEMFAHNSDFRGLLCLEYDSVRSEIMIITLWAGRGLEDSQSDADQGRRRIAASTDLGATSRCYDVLRMVPGSETLEGALTRGR
jgi:hypothetical protein